MTILYLSPFRKASVASQEGSELSPRTPEYAGCKAGLVDCAGPMNGRDPKMSLDIPKVLYGNSATWTRTRLFSLVATNLQVFKESTPVILFDHFDKFRAPMEEAMPPT